MLGFLFRTLFRLALVAAVAIAAYLLLLEPLIDETGNRIDRAFEGGGGVAERIGEELDRAGVEGLEIDLDSARQAQETLLCIQAAGEDRRAIERCARSAGR